MNIPKKLQYTKDHEWVNIDNNIAIIGITDFAQKELGDIIFVEFPEIADQFKSGDTLGTIEAVKTVADIFAPIDGVVSEINTALENNPELLNDDPYEAGWFIKMRNIKISTYTLLTSSEYQNIIK